MCSCHVVRGVDFCIGDKARDVFVKSKLPVDKLSSIWCVPSTSLEHLPPVVVQLVHELSGPRTDMGVGLISIRLKCSPDRRAPSRTTSLFKVFDMSKGFRLLN